MIIRFYTIDTTRGTNKDPYIIVKLLWTETDSSSETVNELVFTAHIKSWVLFDNTFIITWEEKSTIGAVEGFKDVLGSLGDFAV